MSKLLKRVTEYYTDPKQDEPKQVTDTFSEDEKSEIRADEMQGDVEHITFDPDTAETSDKWFYACHTDGEDFGYGDTSDYEKHRGHDVSKLRNAPESLKQIKWTTEDLKVNEATEKNTLLPNSEPSCTCKKKSNENLKKSFEKFVAQQIKVLRKKATEGQSVDLLLGNPTIDGQKIEGVLAYAGVSLNNRLYLPEELAKGDGMTVPLIINHANVAGAEQELYYSQNIPPEIVKRLENEEEIKVGQVVLHWNPDENVLYYEGIVEDEFWIQQVAKGNMAVSLGMYYDADSPQYCPTGTCYTIIKNGEFHEVSLVWNPGFAIATIEAVEVLLKQKAMEALKESQEAVGPHSVGYDNSINEPTSTPEITGSNATQYHKPPSTNVAKTRMNQNMKPSSLGDISFEVEDSEQDLAKDLLEEEPKKNHK